MKKLIVLSGLILACAFLTGCIGLVVAHPRQKCSEQFCLGNRGVVSNSPAPTALTEAKVLDLWGQPDAKQTNQTMTVWQYQGKMGWALVMPAYLIILPLPIPTGHDRTEIFFEDGIARKARCPITVFTGVCLGGINILAWEKEDSDKSDSNVVVGYGFAKADKPVQAKP